jgi:ABC-2 type transport system ATP-binding protein
MSIRISHLTKIYGHQKAVNDISFTIGKGEIVGFLGPNGAGKSTTMKIATGYLPPTSGTVLIDDLDVELCSLQVRKSIGYLPEHNPLYLDMYVHEYLHFVGNVYGISSAQLKIRIAEIIALCGLTKEQNKQIESLSKGYRQRVGIAQALLHDPSVLILDEPTSGLDPNQILEIRKLIRDVSANKTVLFSTHILQEVQALCNRVIVINQGQIVADDSVENLLHGHASSQTVVVEFDSPVKEEALKLLPGLKSITQVSPVVYRIVSQEGVDLRNEIVRLAADHNLALVGLKQEENSLEDIFRRLTEKVETE